MTQFITPEFLSDSQALSPKIAGSGLMINIGKNSPFANPPPQDPWEIDDSLEGVTPYDLWWGISQQVGDNKARLFEAGSKLILWICAQIEAGQDPFKAFRMPLPAVYEEAVQLKRECDRKLSQQAGKADVYLVNGLFFVAVQVSEDPRMLTEQYKIFPYNKIDYSVVYNTEWGKMSVGANTVAPVPQGSASMLVWHNLAEARRLFQETGKIYLPTQLNFDVVTAALLAEGYDLPFAWLKYVEALKLGNFSGRLNKRLPSLEPIGEELSKLEKDPVRGRWGGSANFQGSARGERTAVTDVNQVLTAMSKIFLRAYEGVEAIRLIPKE